MWLFRSFNCKFECRRGSEVCARIARARRNIKLPVDNHRNLRRHSKFGNKTIRDTEKDASIEKVIECVSEKSLRVGQAALSAKFHHGSPQRSTQPRPHRRTLSIWPSINWLYASNHKLLHIDNYNHSIVDCWLEKLMFVGNCGRSRAHQGQGYVMAAVANPTVDPRAHIELLAGYQLIVCKPCRYAVWPGQVQRQYQGSNHKWEKSAAVALATAVQSWSGMISRIQNRCRVLALQIPLPTSGCFHSIFSTFAPRPRFHSLRPQITLRNPNFSLYIFSTLQWSIEEEGASIELVSMLKEFVEL